eukprot:1147772-Pelagomonas_calceolata.AAC.3
MTTSTHRVAAAVVGRVVAQVAVPIGSLIVQATYGEPVQAQQAGVYSCNGLSTKAIYNMSSEAQAARVTAGVQQHRALTVSLHMQAQQVFNLILILRPSPQKVVTRCQRKKNWTPVPQVR